MAILQNELAIQHARNSGLQRVIWLADGTESQSSRQQAFIEALPRDAEVQFGADLVTGDLEKLRSAIHAMLKKLETPAPAKTDQAVLPGTRAAGLSDLR